MGRLSNGNMTMAAKKGSGERKVHMPIHVAFFQSLVGIYTYALPRTCHFPLSLATILKHMAAVPFFKGEGAKWLTQHQYSIVYLTLFCADCFINHSTIPSLIVQLPSNPDSG